VVNSDSSSDLPPEWSDQLFGVLVVDNFNDYLIPNRTGMTVRLVPHRYGTTPPSGPWRASVSPK
jgi:hypothetical protein